MMASAAVAAFDNYWVVDLGDCNYVVTLWLKPSKGACFQGSANNQCYGWDSDTIQDSPDDDVKDSANNEYKPAFAVFVTIAAISGFMSLFSLAVTCLPRAQVMISQLISISVCFFILCLGLGASGVTYETHFTDTANYQPGNCKNAESYGSTGFAMGLISWILSGVVILLTIFPFVKCLLKVVDHGVDTVADGLDSIVRN